MVADFAPMLASPVGSAALPTGGWHYEVKWDGYRALAHVEGGRVRLGSRGGLDLAPKYPEVQELLDLVPGHEAVLDGELVVLDEQGRSSFEGLQSRARTGAAVHLMLFDLLWLDGLELLGLGYLERRAFLSQLVGEGSPHVHVPTTFGDDLDFAMTASLQLGLEGLVAKRVGSPYRPGVRSSDWLKLKHLRSQSIVVAGWSAGENGRAGRVGALVMAVNTPDGLRCAGRVGSGFTQQGLDEAMQLLAPLTTSRPTVPDATPAESKGVTWVRPELVGEVTFTERTSSGRLRHPVWKGWRPDVDPADVVPE